MKNLLLATVAIAFAAPAFAHNGTPTDEIEIKGNLPKKCSIDINNKRNLQNLDMENTTARQGASNVAVTCNYFGDASVTISSDNGGVLKHEDGDATYDIPYTIGFIAPDIKGISLSSAYEDDFSTSSTLNARSGGRGMQVQLTQKAVLAGDYTDVIRVSVVPN